MSNSLDFSRLVSREYRAAGVAQLNISDKYKLKKKKKTVEFADDIEDEKETVKQSDARHVRILHDLTAEGQPPAPTKSKGEREEETSRLVLQLVSKTPAYTRHLQQKEVINIVSDTEFKT
jgi:hypothetical protein